MLIAAGFEISDPEGPITNEQLGLLHMLERELGLTHDQGHADAGVTSYTKLTREQAGDVIDRWQALRDDQGGGPATSPTSADADATDPRPAPSDAVSSSLSGVGTEESPAPEVFGEGAGGVGDPSPASQAPATEEAWTRAPKGMGLSGAVKLAAKMHSVGQLPDPGPGMTSPPRKRGDFTGEQLSQVSAWWRDGERG